MRVCKRLINVLEAKNRTEQEDKESELILIDFLEHKVMLKAKLKEKKKIVIKNLAKMKKKEEPAPYTQAGLLKARNKILSKMPLHEALYRGAIGGKKQNSPDPQPKKSQSLERNKIRIRRSPIKTTRDGSNGNKSHLNFKNSPHYPNNPL